MRRIAAWLAVPAMATLALAGCGSGGSAAKPSSSSPAKNSAVTATGGFGTSPSVSIPDRKAGATLAVKTVVHGNGQKLGKKDAFVGNYAVYVWSGKKHHLAQSTFTGKTGPALFAGQLLPGLKTALDGKKMGSRVLAVIPPKDGYGKSGNPQAGVKGTDTLVFVVDMIKDFSADASASGRHVSDGGGGLPTVTAGTSGAPSVKVPSSATPPSSLVVKTLIQGSGPKVAKGDTVVVQYDGLIWRTGKTFDASWTRGQPFGFQIGASPSQVIPGWDKGLVGVRTGSRVLLVIPPKDGYGKSGNSQVGIKGTDTLVFVVDVLGSFGPHSR